MKKNSKHSKFAFLHLSGDSKYLTHGYSSEVIQNDATLRMAILNVSKLFPEKHFQGADMFLETIDEVCLQGKNSKVKFGFSNPFIEYYARGMHVQYDKVMGRNPSYNIYETNINLAYRSIINGGLKKLTIKEDKKAELIPYAFSKYGQEKPKDDQETKNILSMCKFSEHAAKSYSIKRMYDEHLSRVEGHDSLGDFVSFYSNLIFKHKIREYAHQNNIPMIRDVTVSYAQNKKEYVDSTHLYGNGERAQVYPCVDILTSPDAFFNNLSLLHHSRNPFRDPIMDSEDTKKVTSYLNYKLNYYR